MTKDQYIDLVVAGAKAAMEEDFIYAAENDLDWGRVLASVRQIREAMGK